MRTLHSLLLAATTGALVAVARPAPAPTTQEIAPFVVPGKPIYALVLDEPETMRSLPEFGPVEPIKVLGVDGRWALIGVRGQTRGPVWVNFDQVVSYRTDP